MARLEHQVIPAPKGMDLVSEPYAMPPDKCPYLSGLLPLYNNVLKYAPSNSTVSQIEYSTSSNKQYSGLSGLGYYQGSSGYPSALLTTQYDGSFVTATETAYDTFTTANYVYDKTQYTVGPRARMQQFNDEMIITVEGYTPLRWNGLNLYRCGMQPPAAPTVTPIHVTPGANFTPYASMPQNFDSYTPPALPTGWNAAVQYVGTSADYSHSPLNSFKCAVPPAGTSYIAFWDTLEGNLNEQISAYVYCPSYGSSVVAGVTLRYQNNGKASGYSANILTYDYRQASVLVLSHPGGHLGVVPFTLATGVWYQIVLNIYNNQITVALQNANSNEYLNADGSWNTNYTICISVYDDSQSATGYGGLISGGDNANIYWDDVNYGTATGPNEGGLKAGTYQYKATLVDEKQRESSASVSGRVTLDGVTNNGATISVRLSSDPQVRGANLYVNTNGGSVWYLIAQLNGSPGQILTFTDTMSDAQVQQSYQTAPLPGQNDPPYSANYAVVWNNRLVLSDNENPEQIQISNAGSPTQFASLNVPGYDSFGMRFNVSSSNGDVVQGLAVFGGMLFVFKRSGVYSVQGYSPSTFQVQQINERQCIAPDAITVIDNGIIFISDDGVYELIYNFAFMTQKISADIDSLFMSHLDDNSNTFQSAVGVFWLNIWWLVIPSLGIYTYHPDRQGWAMPYNVVGNGITYSNMIVVNDTYGVSWLALGHSNWISISPTDPSDGGGFIFRFSPLYGDSGNYSSITYTTHYFGNDKTTRKRPRRFRLFGTMTVVPNPGYFNNMQLILITERGHEQTYTVDSAHLQQDSGILLEWMFTETICRQLAVLVYLWGRNIVINDCMMEWDTIDE